MPSTIPRLQLLARSYPEQRQRLILFLLVNAAIAAALGAALLLAMWWSNDPH